MIRLRMGSEEVRDSSSPKSVITSALSSMDLNAFSSTRRNSVESHSSFYCTEKGNPFEDTFPDPLCKLNLKETSEFVKAFPTATKGSNDGRSFAGTSAQRRREGMSSVGHRRVEAPSTPGRPVFSFSPGHISRKNIPSKWEDAEKWLICSSSSSHESPSHLAKPADSSKAFRQSDGLQQKQLLMVAEEKPSNSSLPSFNAALFGASSEVLLKDKFVEPVYPNFRYLEPSKEGFLFNSSFCKPMKDTTESAVGADLLRRDFGTETTPLASSKTTRCHTPTKISSPARHNTPADRSGPMVPCKTSINISELKVCHFAKLELSAQYDSFVSNWSSREEEEEEVSKSLRRLEISRGRKNIADSRASSWEEEERSKSCCIRYQREEAKIQAWVNLESAKAEAQSRKLEVKIQKMRSNLEEKLMKRMATVNRRAEEWRAAAQLQHTQQLLRASENSQKLKKIQQGLHFPGCHHTPICSCFPCNGNHI